VNTAAAVAELQALMNEHVGPFRTGAGLQVALAGIARLRQAVGTTPPGSPRRFDTARLDWFDLRNMLLVAEVVARAALTREESRGAHQRDDLPDTDDGWTVNQTVRLREGGVELGRVAVAEAAAA